MAQSLDAYPAKYWHELADERIQCDVCPSLCKLHERQRAFCFVRARQHDQIVLTKYGQQQSRRLGDASLSARNQNISLA